MNKKSKSKTLIESSHTRTIKKNIPSISEKIGKIEKKILKTHSLKHIANFLKIFRVVLNEEDNGKINIEEGFIFNDLMKFGLAKLPEVLKEILDLVINFIFLFFYINKADKSRKFPYQKQKIGNYIESTALKCV